MLIVSEPHVDAVQKLTHNETALPIQLKIFFDEKNYHLLLPRINFLLEKTSFFVSKLNECKVFRM